MDPILASVSEVLRLETAVLVIVVVAVVILAKMVMDLKAELRGLRRQDPQTPPAPTAQPVPASASVTAPADEVTPEIFTAIVAAIHLSVGDQLRVVSVTPMESLWSREGRRTIFGSHSTR